MWSVAACSQPVDWCAIPLYHQQGIAKSCRTHSLLLNVHPCWICILRFLTHEVEDFKQITKHYLGLVTSWFWQAHTFLFTAHNVSHVQKKKNNNSQYKSPHRNDFNEYVRRLADSWIFTLWLKHTSAPPLTYNFCDSINGSKAEEWNHLMLKWTPNVNCGIKVSGCSVYKDPTAQHRYDLLKLEKLQCWGISGGLVNSLATCSQSFTVINFR